MNELGVFEDKPVVAADVILRGTGDGLSAALRVDPARYAEGERIVLAIEAVVREIRHDPVDKDEPKGEQVRVHIAHAATATVLDARSVGAVTKALEGQRDRIQRAKDEAAGQLTIDA